MYVICVHVVPTQRTEGATTLLPGVCASRWPVERDISGKRLRDDEDGASRPYKKPRFGEPTSFSASSSKREHPEGSDNEARFKRVRVMVEMSLTRPSCWITW